MWTRLLTVLLILVAFGLFLLKGNVSLDPDLGWHLRLGQYELAHGVPKTDPFSFTMPHYPFIDHEWLTNITMQSLFEKFGKGGLALVFAILPVLTIWITLLRTPRKYHLIIISLATASLLQYAGVRPQVLSWFFFALLVYLLQTKKWLLQIVTIPFLILFWTNMHGSYPLGIATVAIFLVTKSIEEKKVKKKDVLLLLFSLLVTLINPYGFRLWFEPLTQASDISLHWRISEWMPIIMTTNFAIIIFIPLSAILCFFLRKKMSLFAQVMMVLLFFAGISTSRHFPFYVVFTLPYVVIAVNHLQDIAKKITFGSERFIRGYKVITSIFSIILLLQIFLLIKQFYATSEKSIYPQEAMVYLQKKHYQGNIFTPYEWGGYTLWKLHNVRVFIDGRMPSWKWIPPDSSESASAMDEYEQMSSRKQPVSPAIQKYHIDTFVLTPEKTSKTLSQSKKSPSVFDELRKDGWKRVYSDQIAVVYQKPNGR